MNNINKILYIPLYGKAYVSEKGIILHDQKAEEIWSTERFEQNWLNLKYKYNLG